LPKREYQKTLLGVMRAVAQATSSSLEREAISLKRGGFASARERDSTIVPLF